jgi:hypothetical protein
LLNREPCERAEKWKKIELAIKPKYELTADSKRENW